MRAVCVAMVLAAGGAHAQAPDLGHKLPGTAGLDAGSQQDPGIYVADRFAWFASDQINDRHGNAVPITNLDIDAYANVFGLAGTVEVDGLYLSAAIGVPIAKATLSADQPEASIDRLGLGDVFVQPIRLGTRLSRLDAVASYSFYAPTSETAHVGVGRPQWSHQVSAGGTLFFDDRRDWRVSVLASYLHNEKKLGIDITRGDSIQVQGGVGGRAFNGVVEFGVAGYALWQVTDDGGSDLPDVLRGARDRTYGLGPEVDLAIPSVRSRLSARLEWDLDGEARPVGTILVVGVTAVVWR